MNVWHPLMNRKNPATRTSSIRRQRSTRRKAVRLELLEDRRLLDASVPSLDLQPNWFETVKSRFEAGFVKGDVYGPVEWLEASVSTLQLTPDAIDDIGTIGDLEAWFPGDLSIHVMHGLGAPGELAVGIASRDADAVLEIVRSHPGIASVTPSVEIVGSLVPDDPEFAEQHGLSNTGQNGGNSDADVDAEQAWDITTGSLDNVVAVIDSGVDYTHPDLFLNIWINQGEIDPTLLALLIDTDSDGQITFRDLNHPVNASHVSDINASGFIDAGDLLADVNWENGIDEDGNGFTDDLFGWDFRDNDNDPFDEHRHGTHVTGTIAATGNNGTGVAGLNWQAQVMPLRFLDSNNRGSTADAIPAINYATMMRTNYDVNVRATNNSWGSIDGDVPSLESAIASSGIADILFVAGAGNGNVLGQGIDLDQSPQKFFPASYTGNNIISVAAGDTDDTVSVFSNFGASSIDLLAPGVGILSTQPSRGYATRNGTSMAAPHVTGAALLVWANLPDATMNEVRRALLESVDTKPSLSSKLATGGRLNAFGALDIDTFAPRATLLSSTDITNDGDTDHLVEITYTDNEFLALCAAPSSQTCSGQPTLSDSDLIVFREDDPNDLLDVSLDYQGSVFPVASTIGKYLINAPGGTWDIEDNGTYQVKLRAGQVGDTNGNVNFEIELGSFEVNIAFTGQIDVTTTVDGTGTGTLRAAIQQANTNPDENTLVLEPQTYTLSLTGVDEDAAATGDLDVAGTLTIIGNGATIDAASLDRVFDVAAGATLNLQDVTITGGNVQLGNGGGILDRGGTINLTRTTLTGNIASDDGGGIHVAGALHAVNTTISGNSAEGGGGISAAASSTLDITNTTITDNQANTIGGGILALSNQSIHNTIVAGNTSLSDADVSGSFTGSSFNLIGDIGNATGLTDSIDGNQVGSSVSPLDPLLGPLNVSGGLTATHILSTGSPAIDAADNTLAPNEDQRQFARPLDANRDDTATADIGATEKYFGEIRGQKFLDRNGDGIKQIANDFPFIDPQEMTAVGDTLFFTLDDGVKGRELWKSDRFGTQLVRDVVVGAAGSAPTNLTDLNGALFFTVDDGFRGNELWTSDGTKDGTRLVKDINPGFPDPFSPTPDSSFPTNLTAAGNTLFFEADDGVNGIQLWKSDGTENGTALVKIINPSGVSTTDLTAVGSTLFFTADDGTNGLELWKSQGTAFTTEMVADINPSGSSIPRDLIDIGGTLLFSATDEFGDEELYSSSGAFSSVTKIDVNTSGSSFPARLTNANGTLLFAASDADGAELWKTEAPYTSATQVTDIASGAGSSQPRDLVLVGSTVFFTADDGSSGRELWKSESPYSTAVKVTDINSNPGGSNPTDLIALNGQLLFTADDGVTGRELWVSDGTSGGTMLLSDINPLAAGSTPTGHVNVDGRTFFIADNGINANQLWSTDGRPENTLPVADISEPGMPGHTIYLDTNENGVFDQGEPTALTNSDDPLTPEIDESGTYVFASVEPNRYIVRELTQIEFSQTLPSLDAVQGVFELGDLSINNGADGALGTELNGASSQDAFSSSASSAGDINGDGFDDVIIGAPSVDEYGFEAGAAYLLFGSASGIPPQTSISQLATGTGTDGIVLISSTSTSKTGWAVSAAGDMNGDGFDDLAVAAPFDGDGKAYVVFGRPSFDGPTFDLSLFTEPVPLNGPEGFVISGGANNTRLGESVSSAGDVNGDGFDDLLVGDRFASPNDVSNAGAAYLIFGSDSSGITPESPPEETLNVNVSTFATGDGSKGVEFRGVVSGDQTGASVTSAGDFNNDGFSDFAIGAPTADDTAVDSGRLYVIYGTSSGYAGVVNLSTLLPSNGADGTKGFVLVGEDTFGGENLGGSVSSGDFNADGFSDLLVGGDDTSNSGPYLFYGNDSQPALSYAATIPNGDGSTGTEFPYSLLGEYGAGSSVSFAGDVNDDGFDDLLIGWSSRNSNGNNSGAAYLVYGRENSLGGTFDLSQLESGSGEFGIGLHGENPGDEIGKIVANAGDINGDGASDIIVGSTTPNNSTGRAYLLYGSPRGVAYTLRSEWIADLDPGNSAVDVDFGSVALPGAISGTTFRDLNGNAIRDAGETGVAGFTVFIDENVNGILDEGEPSRVTDVDGRYSFANLEAFQDYTVVQIPLAGLEQTFPTSANNNVWSIALGAGQVITNANFGNKDLIAGVGAGSISGRLWDDVDGDGEADSGENGIVGQQIYIDLNNNGSKDSGEPVQSTDATGNYTFNNIGSGVFTVRLVKPPQQELTTPRGSSFSAESLSPDQGPQAIASGDLNGDTFEDLIVANFVTNNLSIFFNNGDGTFGSRVSYPTGFGPISVAVEDVDGINGKDLVIGHQLSSFIGVLKNNGDGTFAAMNQIPVGAGPVSVAVADINGTNGPDIVVANQYTNQATVLYNNGNGGFNTAATLAVGTSPFDVTVGQFDNQFGPDLAVVNSASGDVSIWLHTGGSGFAASVTKTVGQVPLSIDSGDLNNDGIIDLVTANVLGDSVSVLYGIGNGTFQNSIDLPAGSGPSSVSIADIDSDNRPDLLVTNGGADNLAVLKNLGGGQFQSPENFGVAQIPISLAWASTAADFNSDGVLDVAVANGHDDSISILSNTLVDGAFRIAMTGDETVANVNFGIRSPTPTVNDSLGLFNQGNFYLDTSGNGQWDKTSGGDTFSNFGISSIADIATPVTGDWDGDTVDDVGLYYQGTFYLDTTGNGKWDKTSGGDTFINFGISSIAANATPLIGDWNGDGTDNLGLFNQGNFYLDTTGNGQWDKTSGGDTFSNFGITSLAAIATPVVGDWDGNGTDDLGLFYHGQFYLDTTGNGKWDKTSGGDTFRNFGISSIADIASHIIGDWNGDGSDNLALYTDGKFYLDTTGNGKWDKTSGGDTFRDFGIAPIAATANPVIGVWGTPSPLLAKGGQAVIATTVEQLTDDALAPIVQTAIDILSKDSDPATLPRLQNLDVRISDLPGARLGEARGNSITLDTNAAGYGWFIDSTPDDDSEFQEVPETSTLDSRLRMDLLTVVMHELQHVLGHGHTHESDDLLNPELPTGTRRLPADDLDTLMGKSDLLDEIFELSHEH